MIHIRRDIHDAYRLAMTLAPSHLLYLDDGEVQDGTTYPVIDYRRDSLLEIHEKLAKRKISSTSPGEN